MNAADVKISDRGRVPKIVRDKKVRRDILLNGINGLLDICCLSGIERIERHGLIVSHASTQTSIKQVGFQITQSHNSLEIFNMANIVIAFKAEGRGASSACDIVVTDASITTKCNTKLIRDAG